MFDIAPDHERRLLRITLRGFWTPEVMREYMREVRGATDALQRTGGCKYILIDMLDFAIQPKEIAEGHAENLRVVKRVLDAKVALVLQSALSKLQAARVASDTGHRSFGSEREAMDWLFGVPVA